MMSKDAALIKNKKAKTRMRRHGYSRGESGGRLSQRVAGCAPSQKGYGEIHAGIIDLLEAARRAVARSINAAITATYWEIGRRITSLPTKFSRHCLENVLKAGKFSHSDAGQMHLYLNYAREHWTKPGENPPVGLIICAAKGVAEARYALEGLPNKVLAAEYQTVLPDEEVLAQELVRTRRHIEARRCRRSEPLALAKDSGARR